jgi:hypothetical protein
MTTAPHRSLLPRRPLPHGPTPRVLSRGVALTSGPRVLNLSAHSLRSSPICRPPFSSQQNRVKAKTGAGEHTGRFEQGATASRAGAYAPVRSVAKPPARVFQTERKTDIGYTPGRELRQKLEPVFQHYCGYGEKDNYTYMSRAQFLKFARDCDLVGPHTR